MTAVERLSEIKARAVGAKSIEQGDTDQPPGISGDSRDYPPASDAAERVDEFVRWFGDGEVWDRTPLGDEPDEPIPPLYARDLAALARSVRDVPRLAAALRAVLALHAPVSRGRVEDCCSTCDTDDECVSINDCGVHADIEAAITATLDVTS